MTDIQQSNIGRPSRYSTELVDEMCRYIETGVPTADACVMAGISKATYYYWKAGKYISQQQLLEFLDRIEEAESKRKANFVIQIAKASKDDWRAGAWYLERVYPQEFAKVNKLQIEGELKHLHELSNAELDQAILEGETIEADSGEDGEDQQDSS